MAEPGANALIGMLGEEQPGLASACQWERMWAPPMLAQLRMLAVRDGDNPRVREVVRTVLANPDARRIRNSSTDMWLHAVGDTRPMLLPTYGTTQPVWVQIWAVTPCGGRICAW